MGAIRLHTCETTNQRVSSIICHGISMSTSLEFSRIAGFAGKPKGRKRTEPGRSGPRSLPVEPDGSSGAGERVFRRVALPSSSPSHGLSIPARLTSPHDLRWKLHSVRLALHGPSDRCGTLRRREGRRDGRAGEAASQPPGARSAQHAPEGDPGEGESPEK